MTTIKSTHIDSDMITVTLGKGQGHHSCPPAGEVWLDVILREQRGRVNANVPTADLLAALDATANTDVKHRADAYEYATKAVLDRDMHQLKAVAIAAERDHWKARAEKAEADHEDTKAAYRALGASHAELLTRAEKAEAEWYDTETLVKVREGLRAAGIHSDEINDAITQMQNRGILFREHPKPAFTLPTEAGAEFMAERDGREERFITFSDGERCVYEGRGGFNDAASMATHWTITRISGAES